MSAESATIVVPLHTVPAAPRSRQDRRRSDKVLDALFQKALKRMNYDEWMSLLGDLVSLLHEITGANHVSIMIEMRQGTIVRHTESDDYSTPSEHHIRSVTNNSQCLQKNQKAECSPELIRMHVEDIDGKRLGVVVIRHDQNSKNRSNLRRYQRMVARLTGELCLLSTIYNQTDSFSVAIPRP